MINRSLYDSVIFIGYARSKEDLPDDANPLLVIVSYD